MLIVAYPHDETFLARGVCVKFTDRRDSQRAKARFVSLLARFLIASFRPPKNMTHTLVRGVCVTILGGGRNRRGNGLSLPCGWATTRVRPYTWRGYPKT